MQVGPHGSQRTTRMDLWKGAAAALLLVALTFYSRGHVGASSFLAPTATRRLSPATPSLVNSGCCRFAPHYQGVDWQDPKVREDFMANVLSVERRFFAAPDVAFDRDSGMTYDGTSLNLTTGGLQSDGLRVFSAASKEALHLSLLAIALQPPQDVDEERRELLPLVYSMDEALEILEKKVSSMEDFDRRFPACGGFLPWFCSRGISNGSCKGLNETFTFIEPKVDSASVLSVPALDNGQMAWAAVALVQVLQKRSSESSRISTLAQRWENRLKRMRATAVNLFYDGPGTGTVRAIATIKNASVDAANNSTNAYNAENYVLWDPFEGEMVVLFIDLMGNWSNYTDPQAEKDKIWNIKAQHVDPVLYNESNNTYVIQEGFWFSAHEQWKTLQLPYLQIPLVHHLFRNGEMARLTFSVVKNLNGLMASVNAPTGFHCDSASGAYCSALGIQSLAEQPILTDHVLTPYGAFPAILIEPAAGLAWYQHMLRMPRAQTALGSIESFLQNGTSVAAMVTWDAKVTSVVAMLGGTGDLVRARMETEGVMDTFVQRVESMYADVFQKPLAQTMKKGESMSARIAELPALPLPADQAMPSEPYHYAMCGCASP
ncbi:unnamed protein product [Durusdinium trenchii]|uniref:Endo-beta-1,2-glucanase SGL domain-containing protein n=1 Tax=Durusdinium trenchii TaxID=1381693 RepID=A0ABP0I411_9DINO